MKRFLTRWIQVACGMALCFLPHVCGQDLSRPNITPQPDDKTIKGCFYVSVDDTATIFVNGRQVMHAHLNESASEKTSLNIGDVIAIHFGMANIVRWACNQGATSLFNKFWTVPSE